MKLHVPGLLSLRSRSTTSSDLQRKKLSDCNPKCHTVVGQVDKNANDVLEDQVNDGGKDGNAPASERAALGTLYSDMRWALDGAMRNETYQRQHRSYDRKYH